MLDYDLTFCRKRQDNRCTIKFLPDGYSEPKFENQATFIELSFLVTGKPQCSFSGDIEEAKDFPLAKLADSFTHVNPTDHQTWLSSHSGATKAEDLCYHCLDRDVGLVRDLSNHGILHIFRDLRHIVREDTLLEISSTNQS